MQPSTSLKHPEHLARADRSYIVAWGRREVAGVLAGTSLAAALAGGLAWTHSPAWLLLLVPVLPAAALLVLFFRNPRRDVPRGPGLIVSPADGTVTDIARVEEPELIEGPAVRIGIFLSIFSVHVNRAPASGRVAWVRHREGAHHDARRGDAARENESNLIAIVCEDEGGPDGLRILVKQIAGAIARRIVCPLSPGDPLERGGLVGMIKYGSRTELYIPTAANPEVLVSAGSKVHGGSTVLAKL
ncbi:MAG: phosphatidylserine decarboxylase family protein [Planctomycetes bacterium]|nr:phosphatidylserine decarboxylase family protein [Planctomycetota bacterium]